MDVSLILPGRWGLSRPIQAGGWTTVAAQQRLAPIVENYWPPIRNGSPVIDAVLVRLVGEIQTPDEDTQLLPLPINGEVTLAQLPLAQRNNLTAFLSDWLTGYSFTELDVPRVIPDLPVQAYNGTTTLRRIVQDIYRHLGHSITRDRPAARESHNTEFLDDFSTDPFAVGTERWTNERGTAVWDSTNEELDADLTVGTWGARYSVNGPGSIEHESQATFTAASPFWPASGGAAIRMHDTGTDDWYFTAIDPDADEVRLERLNAGSATLLATFTAVTMAAGDFLTHRLASEGAAGANVDLSLWHDNHGATKPSDPGWFGTDGSPDQTYSDTSVDRLDDSTHAHCGIGGRGQGIDADSRHCFWKSRAISDRAGTTKRYSLSLTGVG